MKFITFFLLVFSFVPLVLADCITCYSLEEAVKNPLKVRQLILRNKGLNTFPEEILGMKGLRYLDLSQNNIITFPVGEATNSELTHLILSRNLGLNTHSLFGYTQNIAQLEFLDISDCKVGQLSYAIGMHPMLQELNVSGNDLVTLPGELGKLSKLNVLNVSRNSIEQIPYLLSELYSLTDLDISQNLITHHDGIFISLGAHDKLRSLTLSLDQEGNKLSPKLATLPLLTLRFVNSNFEAIPPAVFRLNRLETLIFDHCGFNSRIQSNMDWSSMKKMDKMEFINCSSLPNMRNLSDVKTIRVFGENEIGPDTFCKMSKVQELNLSGQPVVIQDLKAIQRCLPTTNVLDTSLRDNIQKTQLRTPIREVETELFTFDSDSPMVIRTEKMFLNIPPNAFRNKDGSLYKGTVEVRLKEFFDPVSMFLEQIPMTFDNNGKEEVFGSNGMFEFRAFDQRNNELQPNNESLIQVTLEDQQPNNRGELFYFDDSSNEWQRAPANNRLDVINFDSLRMAILDSLMALPDSRFVDIPAVPIYIYFKPSVKSLSPSEFEFIATNPKRSNPRKNSGLWQSETNYDQYLITRYTWKLDTTVSHELSKYFREVRREQKRPNRRSMRKGLMFSNLPRPIKNLQVTPDFERDCFMMSFSYRDTLLAFPVYLASKTETKDLAIEQKRFYEKYIKAKRLEEKSKQRIDNQLKNLDRIYANQLRESMAYNLAMMEIQGANEFMGNNALQFNLVGFGLVNCDYFSRNPVSEIVHISGELVDEEGREIEVPLTVSLLMMNTNSSLSYGPKNIPITSRDKTLIAFISKEEGKIHVAKIKNVLNGIAQLVIATITIEGLTAKQIRNQINKVAE